MTNPYGPPQQPGYGVPMAGNPGQQPGHGAPMAAQAAAHPGGCGPPAPETNGVALAAMAVSLFAIIFGPVVGVVGLVLGHVALRQIKRQPHRYEGRGAALTGVLVGWSVCGLWILLAGLMVFLMAGS